MITTIYLVKKNPNKPNSEDNWLMMSIAEFNEFVKTPEAKGRYFADLGAHEYSDIWYVAECDKETALKWRKELNRHYYLKRMERESGLQTVSMSSLIIEDEEYNGEEIIAVGGCGHGADYALTLIPGHSNNLFETKVIDIICKPRIS